MRSFRRESDFQLQTQESYENDVSKLDDLPLGKNHCRVVKTASLFNELLHFHICEN